MFKLDNLLSFLSNQSVYQLEFFGFLGKNSRFFR